MRRSSSIGRSWSSTRRSTRMSDSAAYPPSRSTTSSDGRLLAAPVAARGLRRGEALDQALRERQLRVRLERRRERVDRLRADEDVALRRVARRRCGARPSRGSSAPVQLAASPLRVDDAELALVASLVGRRQPLHDLVGAEALAQQREPVRAVARVRVRLRRDRARPRAPPTGRPSRRRGTSTGRRRPTAPPRGRRRRSSTSRRRLSHTSARSGRARAGRAGPPARARTPPRAARAPP